MLNRRTFLSSLAGTAVGSGLALGATRPLRIVLRSSWQTVNIGDIAHTPGMLALLEKYRPQDQITLWPNTLSADVEKILTRRFPKLTIAQSADAQQKALDECDFFLHGSGPGLVGRKEAERAQKAGKPYGFAGLTLSDDELKNQRALLAGAKFVFTRDGDSLKALIASGVKGPRMEFGPDATFALDLRDDSSADTLLKKHELTAGKFLVAVPRLRWTPYWEIHPERVNPNPDRSAVNEAFAERDHAKMREAIIAWVRTTKNRVLLAPEMTYAVPRLKPLLFDPLPADVKPAVTVMDRYWLTAEAASTYARAALVVSFEMHSPIMAISAGIPAIHLRQPTDTRKGQMWREIGLDSWLFEIDSAKGSQIAERVLSVASNPAKTADMVAKARKVVTDRMSAMMMAIG